MQPTKAESRGVGLVRFASAAVENDLDGVLASIRAARRLPFN